MVAAFPTELNARRRYGALARVKAIGAFPTCRPVRKEATAVPPFDVSGRFRAKLELCCLTNDRFGSMSVMAGKGGMRSLAQLTVNPSVQWSLSTSYSSIVKSSG